MWSFRCRQRFPKVSFDHHCWEDLGPAHVSVFAASYLTGPEKGREKKWADAV